MGNIYENENNKEILKKALNFAAGKHAGQKRKGTTIPYFTHIASVVEILLNNNATYEVCAAGALHDTLEDTNTSIKELVENFGVNIATMVDTVTERKSLNYMDRKHMQSLRIKDSCREVKMIKCADCLANLRDTLKDYKIPNFWQRFNAPKTDIAQHYKETINAIQELSGLKMYEELKSIYEEIFIKNTNPELNANDKEEIKNYIQTINSHDLYQEQEEVKSHKLDVNLLKNKQKEEKTCKNEQQMRHHTICNNEKQTFTIKENNRPTKYCTDCNHMGRITTPDPDDWFNDDDQTYYCKINNKVLSEMNRPYEKQIAPKDCPLEK